GVFTNSGAHVDIAAVNPINAFRGFDAHEKLAAGAAGIGLFFAFWSWVGFEMAPNYAEESRDPKRIVPQSILLSVVGLGIFYVIVSWCAVSSYPTEADMAAKAFSDGVNFFLTPIQQFVGTWAFELMFLLILTSSFACGMAFH